MTSESNSLQWRSFLFLDRGDYQIPTTATFELDGRYLYYEKLILIECLERMLEGLDALL